MGWFPPVDYKGISRVIGGSGNARFITVLFFILQDTETLGDIHMEEMMSVARCEHDEVSKDPKYQHCFEVNTQGRGYLFCADSEADMEEWIKIFEKIIETSNAAEIQVSVDHVTKQQWYSISYAVDP